MGVFSRYWSCVQTSAIHVSQQRTKAPKYDIITNLSWAHRLNGRLLIRKHDRQQIANENVSDVLVNILAADGLVALIDA